ncbi:MAG: membrane protein insertase YidC [Arenicella sp.]|nr:membrane protein insertase YidC [Arenicella sp.]
MTFIADPLFTVLSWIHDVVGNWGWAIILLTILIKLMFYPLSAASYRSMGKMKKLQPRMATLKERYKDDRQKFQVEMMALYKKEKVNPAGGCLPILIQIPVFIALYWVLLESVEMRHAPFALWWVDLSAKDPYYVLPVLMGVSMFLMQKLNPAPMDDIQKKVMMIMPFALTFLFMTFPQGLVLYWVVNNVLTMAQQWFNYRQQENKA